MHALYEFFFLKVGYRPLTNPPNSCHPRRRPPMTCVENDFGQRTKTTITESIPSDWYPLTPTPLGLRHGRNGTGSQDPSYYEISTGAGLRGFGHLSWAGRGPGNVHTRGTPGTPDPRKP